jgi:hypothetical protein
LICFRFFWTCQGVREKNLCQDQNEIRNNDESELSPSWLPTRSFLPGTRYRTVPTYGNKMWVRDWKLLSRVLEACASRSRCGHKGGTYRTRYRVRCLRRQAIPALTESSAGVSYLWNLLDCLLYVWCDTSRSLKWNGRMNRSSGMSQFWSSKTRKKIVPSCVRTYSTRLQKSLLYDAFFLKFTDVYFGDLCFFFYLLEVCLMQST